MYLHPIGELSPSGVLDVGLRCPHSCKFCYYSFWDGGKDQFSGIRKAPWRDEAELRQTLENFASWGLTHFDCTGGEPSLHPRILEVMRYAHYELGLRARMITLGQFLMKRVGGGDGMLIERLIEAGVEDYLLSLHDVSEERFHEITGCSVRPIVEAMDYLEGRSMDFTVNTVVYDGNFAYLPEIARFLAGRPVRFVNFIVMKLEFTWSNQRDKAIDRKARYSDLAPYLTEAVSILECADVGVNIRYGPFCAYKGLERNLIGFKALQLDPYEWRNGLRGGVGEGPYGKPPFLFFDSIEEYLEKHPASVETDRSYNMVFGHGCRGCALRAICDGVDRDYIARHGWDEFEPYDGEPTTDLMHFRYSNRRPHLMKEPPRRISRAAKG